VLLNSCLKNPIRTGTPMVYTSLVITKQLMCFTPCPSKE